MYMERQGARVSVSESVCECALATLSEDIISFVFIVFSQEANVITPVPRLGRKRKDQGAEGVAELTAGLRASRPDDPPQPAAW